MLTWGGAESPRVEPCSSFPGLSNLCDSLMCVGYLRKERQRTPPSKHRFRLGQAPLHLGFNFPV